MMIQHEQCPGVCRASGAGGGYPRSEPWFWHGDTPLHAEAASFPKIWSSHDARVLPTSGPQRHTNLLEPQAPQSPAPVARLQSNQKQPHGQPQPSNNGWWQPPVGTQSPCWRWLPRWKGLCAPLSALRACSSEMAVPMAWPQEAKKT